MENMSMQQVIALRTATRKFAINENSRLREYLATLAPVMRPASVLGDFIAGATGSLKTAKTVAEFTALFGQVASEKPYNENTKLKGPVEISDMELDLRPFQYRYPLSHGNTQKTVTVTSPLRWILEYKGYGLDGLRSALTQDGTRASIVQFLVHILMVNFALRPARVSNILAGLRYEITTTMQPEFGTLPLTCIALAVPTLRPTDEVIMEITKVSGVDQAEEVLAPETMNAFRDPLREQIDHIFNGDSLVAA